MLPFVHTYATIQKLKKKKKKAFTVKNQNKKQTNGIQVTVNLEIKLQKEQFFSKIGFF